MSTDARATAAAHMKAKYGVGEEAFEWAEQTMNAGDRVSLAYRIFCGDARAFKELADKFIKHMEVKVIQGQEGWKR
jgi:thioredoxin reductase